MTTTWTRQQHAFTSRLHPQTFTQKFAGTRNCPTLPLHWIVVTSHLTPRQIKQKVMGIHLVELFFFLSTWSLYCEFPINFPSNEFLLLENSFLAWVKFPPKLHMIQNTFHKNYRMIPSSPTPPGDLRSATLHCNRSLQSTVGYTYLNLNSQVEKWIFGAWKNFKLDLRSTLVDIWVWKCCSETRWNMPSRKTHQVEECLFFQDWEQSSGVDMSLHVSQGLTLQPGLANLPV